MLECVGVARDGAARQAKVGALLALLGLSLLGACSAIVDSDASKLGALPIACETGRSVSCPCPDGTTSTQTCNKYARYDVCACKGQAGRAGAAGSAASGPGAGAVGH
jgi:hypothetical protein